MRIQITNISSVRTGVVYLIVKHYSETHIVANIRGRRFLLMSPQSHLLSQCFLIWRNWNVPTLMAYETGLRLKYLPSASYYAADKTCLRNQSRENLPTMQPYISMHIRTTGSMYWSFAHRKSEYCKIYINKTENPGQMSGCAG